ncbi:F-actin-monooxygenase MICAL2 [Eurytemora carolleeae]|uniref:F-actin-monooxygenase MICAL2 n=1 Tax=Eurytemora carolleeae TaxID=1294199 RepID=UPI000C78D7ED|nr:F-actin-monooxygenase MICAL2 [Eurytemora carolleeae]|eukprot:XP_023330453.1 F-actin-monooxygenase MICAL2-like [Eurytemora affinis]
MKITEGREMMEILNDFKTFISRIGIIPGHINNFFPAFRTFVKREVSFKFNDLLDKLEKRRHLPEYKGGLVGRGKKVLIIGAGPCGLRLALETQLLGAETTVIESRSSIDRNNILKLWSFVVEDLKGLGGKKLCPNLGISCLNHISIKTLQLILLKICLILGVRIKPRQTFKAILEPSSSSWPVLSDIQCDNGGFVEEEEEFDVVIGATGRRVTLDGFERQSLEAKMAIAITVNFRNFNTEEEKCVKEIPGLSKQYDLQFFSSLERERGIKLENIVYYQGDTHYFVMTAKKESLLRKGVLYRDLGERMELLRPENVNRKKLEEYAREASEFATAHFSKQLPRRPFAEWKGVKDVSIFDFTNLYRSQNASRIIQRRGFTLLTGLVGDSLLEPFWPEGTGIGQGFLGTFDTAWMVKRYFENTDLYETIREREKLYSLLRQSTQTSLKKNFESKRSKC